MPFKDHLDNTLKLTPVQTPVPRMVLCSLCTTLPLILGYFLHQLPLSIFGGLFGFVLILNDHFGPYKKRIAHLTVTFIFLSLAFYLGAMISQNIPLTAISLFIISFILGKSKDYGVELERLLLFMALQILTASGSPSLAQHFPGILMYCFFAYINYLLCLTLVHFFLKSPEEFIHSKRETLQKIFLQKHSTRFALIFSITTTIGYLLANWMHIGRGYWVVGTTLIVMLPDTYKSFYKSIQRLLGTFLGVVAAAFLVQLGHDPILLIFFVLISAFFAPLGLLRNYWLGNIFIAALILFLLEISSPDVKGSIDLAKLRTLDIALGCLLGVIGTLINDPSVIIPTLKKE
jgi:MFS family permease